MIDSHTEVTAPRNTNATQNRTTITVTWTPPSPAPLNGYLVYYSATGDEGSVSVSSGSVSQTVITGRQADRVYTVSVVALSAHLPSALTAAVPAVRPGTQRVEKYYYDYYQDVANVPVVILFFFSDPYVELSGQVLPDDSLVADTDIDSSPSRNLRCVTARMDCCSVADIDAAWYLPNGSSIRGTNVLSSGEGFTLGSVALVSRSLVSGNQGIYRCTVPESDPAANTSTISYYVGIYNHGQGECFANYASCNWLQSRYI